MLHNCFVDKGQSVNCHKHYSFQIRALRNVARFCMKIWNIWGEMKNIWKNSTKLFARLICMRVSREIFMGCHLRFFRVVFTQIFQSGHLFFFNFQVWPNFFRWHPKKSQVSTSKSFYRVQIKWAIISRGLYFFSLVI